MRLVFASLLAAIAFCAPVSGQSVHADYEIVGHFNGQVDDNPVTFVALRNSLSGSSDVQLNDPDAFGMLRVIVRSVSETGTPASPGFSLTIGPLDREGVPSVDVFYFGADGYFFRDIDIGGRVPLQSFDISNGEMHLSLDAVLTPVARDGEGGLMEDRDRAPIRVKGTFSGVVSTSY